MVGGLGGKLRLAVGFLKLLVLAVKMPHRSYFGVFGHGFVDKYAGSLLERTQFVLVRSTEHFELAHFKRHCPKLALERFLALLGLLLHACLELRKLEMEQNSRALRTAVVGNLGLMGLNVFIAVRGVKIWHLLQRVGVENWIRTIASQLPWTRRFVRVINVGTYPVRQVLRPFRLLGGGLRARQLREIAAREAAERARARNPVHMAYRSVKGVSKFAEKKTWETLGFAENSLRWMVGWERRG